MEVGQAGTLDYSTKQFGNTTIPYGLLSLVLWVHTEILSHVVFLSSFSRSNKWRRGNHPTGRQEPKLEAEAVEGQLVPLPGQMQKHLSRQGP